MKPNRESISTSFVVLLAIFALSTFASVVWGSNKSLSLKDEGLYLLAARYPEEISQNVSAVYRYTNVLFRAVGYDVASFRVLGLMLIVLSAIIFWAGLSKFLFATFNELAKIRNYEPLSFLFVTLGALLHYQWSLSTPSYYTLTSVLANSSAGLTLFAIGSLKPNSSKATAYLALALSGLVIGAAVFIKFPAGVMLGLITGVTLLFWSPASISDRFALAAMMAAGVALWFIMHFIFVQDPATTIWSFREGWKLYQTLGAHAPGSKIIAYPLNVVTLAYSAAFIFWPSYLLLLVFAIWNAARPNSFGRLFPDIGVPAGLACLVAAILTVTGFAASQAARYQPLDSWGMTPFYISAYLGWIFLLLACYLFSVLVSKKNRASFALLRFDVGLIAVFLFAVPFAAAVGTANPLYNVISFYAPAWFGIILLLMTGLMLDLQFRMLFSVVVLLVGSFAGGNIVLGSILAPAEMPIAGIDLTDQKIATQVGSPPHELKLSAEESTVITKLREIAVTAGFQEGDDIIAVNYMPGLVFALGGKSPGHPAFLLGSTGFLNYSKVALQFSDIARRRKALLLIDKGQTEDELKELLNSGDLDFPARYRKVGSVVGLENEFTLYSPTD